jgi:tyrosine-protein phosphatase SIW14
MHRYLTLLVAFFAFATASQAQFQPTAPKEFPNIKIANFGQMDERYYRGAQPAPDDYQSLKDLGVSTIIDLRNDPTDYEKKNSEALGMKYYNIPMSGWKTAEDETVAAFMKIMDDPTTGTVYVHCKAGKHRTGLTGAIYRLDKYGWDYDSAYKEMKNYEYSSWPVHFNIKAYVKDYYDRFGKEKQEAVRMAATAAGKLTAAAGQAN